MGKYQVKYLKSEKGKIKNREAAHRYYSKHKEMVLKTKREKWAIAQKKRNLAIK